MNIGMVDNVDNVDKVDKVDKVEKICAYPHGLTHTKKV